MSRANLLSGRFKKLTTEIQHLTPDGREVSIVAVTKYSPVDDIIISYELGHRDFGENRVLDLQEKANHFSEEGLVEVSWHFIGNLQTKKINRLLKTPGLKFIHSVDSLSLLQNILSKESQFRGERLGLFLQVNTSGEEEKAGFDGYDSLAGAVNHFLDEHGPKFYLAGLMTMGKLRTDDKDRDAKECFNRLGDYKDRLEDDFGIADLKLSMGMSGDYKIAVEEGADFVRVGSTLYRGDDS